MKKSLLTISLVAHTALHIHGSVPQFAKQTASRILNKAIIPVVAGAGSLWASFFIGGIAHESGHALAARAFWKTPIDIHLYSGDAPPPEAEPLLKLGPISMHSVAPIQAGTRLDQATYYAAPTTQQVIVDAAGPAAGMFAAHRMSKQAFKILPLRYQVPVQAGIYAFSLFNMSSLFPMQSMSGHSGGWKIMAQIPIKHGENVKAAGVMAAFAASPFVYGYFRYKTLRQQYNALQAINRLK